AGWSASQRARLWLRAGERERARAFLVEVVERLPRHVPAAVDLGWLDFRLGRRAEGIARLRSATGSEDPEAAALLAQALADAGSAAEAESWRRRAAERYDALVAAHPEAYADHASRFWLGAGGDPARARLLAAKNLENRRTPAAYALMVEAAHAAGDTAAACAAARVAVTFAKPALPARPYAERAASERVL